ncbi:PAS domain-containing protein [Trichocoleus sp. FACHB-591]|uniref:hybrid sensor histidine kinase/response regulator n=1 Tax=Trichocoleus sp. FACHB-591 TaxID=2692872 RepID=UPI00168554D9|nr:PAS domain-containing protein [Trichocoleus sp. FACHB-591]MBD2096358.1 PAS domain-containing protein [Trichocoleus sp. FACHB-591]
MRTSQQIEIEIEQKFGFFPPFFSPALDTPQVLENLWQQTCSTYVDNPLPTLFKEKLSAYLSRFCPVPYCLICHSCSLWELGMQAREILNLLESPPPRPQDIPEHLWLLAAHDEQLNVLSQLDPAVEESLLQCSIFIALNTDETETCRQELRRLLGAENYQYLVTFIAYIKTCHAWMEAYPEVKYEADKRVQDHFDNLIAAEPKLANFFKSYCDIVKHETVGWLGHSLTARLSAQELANSPLARAFCSASDGILLSDPNQPDNPIIYSNPAFSKLTGYQPEEAMGRNCRFLQGPETNPEVVAQLRQAIAQQQEIQVTLLNYRKDGQPFWNELKIAPVKEDTGELLYFVGIQTDVTEREQAEAAMQAQARLLDQSQDAILVLNLENRILFWNSSATRLFGWTGTEAVGCYIDELLFEAFSPQLCQAQTSVVEQGEWQGELHHRAKDGQPVMVDSRWTLIHDQAGHHQSVLVSSTNITERKRVDAQRQQTQRFESINTIATGMAHDLNNALAPILMSIQLLADRLPDEQSRQLLTTLEANTRRSADVVKQVLSFVRGVEGEKNTLCLESWLLDIERVLKQEFPRNILIRTHIASNVWSISGNPAQLQQVLLSLCQNARDAMPEGGILRISADNVWIDKNLARTNVDAKVGSYIAITVSDTGIGIPVENLNRIFEPFFTTKEFGKGTGLGLSMVVGIVKGHGGFVEVESEVDKGTQLKVYLPAQSTLSPNGAAILLVEPDSASCAVAQTILERIGYRVLTAQDGVEAIALYAQHQSEVKTVLINLSIQDPDVVATIRTLQQINPQVVLIAADEFALKEQLEDDVKAMVTAFLNKPYTAEALAAKLQEVSEAIQP